MQVHANGVITFETPSSALPEEAFPNGTAAVAPFWTAVDQQSPTATGNVYYRVTNDSSLAGNLSNVVRDSFQGSLPSMDEFIASQMLIVTWERVKGVGTEKVWRERTLERERERC